MHWKCKVYLHTKQIVPHQWLNKQQEKQVRILSIYQGIKKIYRIFYVPTPIIYTANVITKVI